MVMINTSVLLVVGLAISAAVGLLTGIGWPGFVIGAVLSVALWIMLFFGVSQNLKTRIVPAGQYGATAIAAVVVSFLVYKLSGEKPVMWSVGFIIVGAVTIAIFVARSPKGECH